MPSSPFCFVPTADTRSGHSWLSSRIKIAVITCIALLLGLGACPPFEDGDSANRPTRNPWLVVGIDGGEWRVIEHLWQQGELPNLKALADSGTRAVLKTAYTTSPIIWTTLATGHPPEIHGIEGFTVKTDQGEVPVSSSVRKVPALWNMADRAGLKVASLGWWATWPAETVNGILISDRILRPVEQTFSPDSLSSLVESWKLEAEESPYDFGGNPASNGRDRFMSHVARQIGGDGYDLTLLYYRSVDIECHNSWKYFEPEKFGVRPAEHLANRDRIPNAYAAVDRALGDVLANMPSHTNVIVISDHGFHAKNREELQILVDMNRVLQKLGYVTLRPNGKPDHSKSRVYSYGTAKNRPEKKLRFSLQGREQGGSLTVEQSQAVRESLTRDLGRLTYQDGSSVFLVRDAGPQSRRDGADFEALVLSKGATRRVLYDGEPIQGIVEHVNRVSGTHSANTHGILIAAGPDIQPGADLTGISIFDFAPTLLFALGLPVAADFAGRPFEALLTPEFKESSPLRQIRTWGTMEGWKSAESSPVDQELIDELQSLGYI